jgi:hypothetical protein
MMIEGSGSGSRAGSGSGSIPLTSGSGSGRPKNNTAFNYGGLDRFFSWFLKEK